MKDCYIWLYRGAWQEWDIEDIEMAVPLSPEETDKKRRAIFKHQSQKDRPLFPGTDKREFGNVSMTGPVLPPTPMINLVWLSTKQWKHLFVGKN